MKSTTVDRSVKAIFNHSEYDVASEPSWMTSFYSFILCVFVYDSIDSKWLTNVVIHQKQQSMIVLVPIQASYDAVRVEYRKGTYSVTIVTLVPWDMGTSTASLAVLWGNRGYNSNRVRYFLLGLYLVFVLVFIPLVSQTRLKPSPRLQSKSELFQLK